MSFEIPNETPPADTPITPEPAAKPKKTVKTPPKQETYTNICPYDFCTCSGANCKECVRLESGVRRGQDNAKAKFEASE